MFTHPHLKINQENVSKEINSQFTRIKISRVQNGQNAEMFCLNVAVNTMDCKQTIQYTKFTGAALLFLLIQSQYNGTSYNIYMGLKYTDLLFGLTSSFFRYSSNKHTHTNTHMKWPYEPRKPIISKIPVN